MKKINQYKLLVAFCILPCWASCDYEEVNTNPYEVTDEEANRDGVAVGGSIMSLARQVFPVGTPANKTDIINEYQTSFNVSADVWSGYFSQNNNWYSGSNHLTYYLQDDWTSSTYTSTYTKAYASWKKIKENAEETGNMANYALAQILKISCWHKALETFGPIPYTYAGEGLLVVPYDTEQEVYTAMFNDLKSAITELTSPANSGAKVMEDFDLVYAGDPVKWVKYANSLMLRLAMRLKYCAPDMAKQWAHEALNHSVGVMTAKDDEAKISPNANYAFDNNIAYLASNYQECRMGTSMYAYLQGYKDPRMSKYFTSIKQENSLLGFDGNWYAPVPPGHTMGKGEYTDCSQPNMKGSTPTYWMRASEMYFLHAEAALEWPEFGNAEALYKQGIQMSFDENGVSTSVDSYITGAGAPVFVRVQSPKNSYLASEPTTATPAFEGSQEEKLEKIMIQKWIALYPNGQEAWTEWRRTGYPKLHQVQENRGSANGITKDKGIRRMVYPISFSQSAEDRANYEDAISKLKDKTDKATSRLWWDCR